MSSFDCDVLIAGGGPTGVTLAILLAKRGVKVIVAEKEADIYPLPRAAHIDHECMRILQEAGAADAVFATSRRVARYDFLNAKGAVLLRFDGSDRIGAGGWPAANMIHQPSVETALRRSLAGYEDAKLHSGWELQSFDYDGEGVSACIITPDGERTIRARYLVGADGARSPVREAAGIAFDDLAFEEPWLVVDALVSDYSRLPDANLQICNPERPTTCVLMGEGGALECSRGGADRTQSRLYLSRADRRAMAQREYPARRRRRASDTALRGTGDVFGIARRREPCLETGRHDQGWRARRIAR